MKKPVKKSASTRRQKHNYVNFFGLLAGGLLLGWLISFPINSVIKAEGLFGAAQVTDTQAPVKWDSIPGAESYNIYFKEAKDTTFTYAINTPATINYYVIPNLKSNATYEYKIAAVDKDNKEFLFTPIGTLNLQSAN